VSQRDHLGRALFLARHAGMEAWGVAAIGDTYAGFPDSIVGDLTSLLAFYDLTTKKAP
jgi:vancomycin permeability regulator SanA